MPKRPKPSPTALVVAGVLAVVLAIGVAWVVIEIANRTGGNNLGDDTFDLNAAFMARAVERDGPVLFQDLLGGNRDIYVQHLGDHPREGWRAFRATAPGADRRCTLVWDADEEVFRDERCGTGAVFPADGAGLEQYRAEVEGANKLVIDLRDRR